MSKINTIVLCNVVAVATLALAGPATAMPRPAAGAPALAGASIDGVTTIATGHWVMKPRPLPPNPCRRLVCRR